MLRAMTIGVAFGGAFAGLSVVAYLVAGQRLFNSHFGPVGPIVMAHLVGGTLCGGTAGLLRSLIRSKWSAALVGSVAMLPYCTIAGWVLLRSREVAWGLWEICSVAIAALLIGGYGGVRTWIELENRRQTTSDSAVN